MNILPQKGVRKIERKEYKYVIRSYEPFIEESVRTLVQMISVVRKMKRLGFEYVIVKVPFRERHPNFPLYFSIAVLVTERGESMKESVDELIDRLADNIADEALKGTDAEEDEHNDLSESRTTQIIKALEGLTIREAQDLLDKVRSYLLNAIITSR